MTKFSPEYLSLADDLLRQYALSGDDKLSDILTKENLDNFQLQYTGGRVRDYPQHGSQKKGWKSASENRSSHHLGQRCNIGLRWHVELDLRAIKSLMKMDVLRCKTPEMVSKEISVHLLVYNLIRSLMARVNGTSSGRAEKPTSGDEPQSGTRNHAGVPCTSDTGWDGLVVQTAMSLFLNQNAICLIIFPLIRQKY